MLIPIGDHPNESSERPWVTYGLIGVNVLVYVWALFTHSAEGAYDAWLQAWGYTPIAPRIETYFSSMFMHAGFAHLGGNMLFLWIFGDNVEGRLGHAGFLFAYLASGIAAVLLFHVLAPTSSLPLVGASGAIFGVEGFYFLAFPKNRVRVMFWIFFIWWTWIPARLFLGFSFGLNLLYMLSAQGEKVGGGVAYAAHVGGFAFGLTLAALLAATRPRAEVVGRGYAASTGGRASDVDAYDLVAAAEKAQAHGDHARADALLSAVLRDHVFHRDAAEAALQLGLLRSRVFGRPEAARTALEFAAKMHTVPERRALAIAELQRIT